METGEHVWDSNEELRTRCRLIMSLQEGYLLFTAGRTPLATATMMPGGRELDITMRVDRVLALHAKREQHKTVTELPDRECGVGELLRRRELALRNYMRLDELLYFTMKKKINT